MTREEASKELAEEFEALKNGISPTDWENPTEELKRIIEANTMAIKVLGQEPCEDAISMSVIEDIKAKIKQIACEEAVDDRRWAAGLIYSIKIINKHISGKE